MAADCEQCREPLFYGERGRVERAQTLCPNCGSKLVLVEQLSIALRISLALKEFNSADLSKPNELIGAAMALSRDLSDLVDSLKAPEENRGR